MLIGVVAHVKREDLAHKLIDEVEADVFHFDYGFPSVTGCANNHIRVLNCLNKMSTEGEWCIVLEDDAKPIPNFRQQVKRALLSAPQAQIVGLYLGTGNPDGITQHAIEPAVRAAEVSQSAWIVADWFISTVGYVVRSEWLPGVITALSSSDGPVDNRINEWTHSQGLETWYAQPSLIDHDDSSSVLSAYVPYDRHAHRFGTRVRWNKRSVTMGHCEGWSP